MFRICIFFYTCYTQVYFVTSKRKYMKWKNGSYGSLPYFLNYSENISLVKYGTADSVTQNFIKIVGTNIAI